MPKWFMCLLAVTAIFVSNASAQDSAKAGGKAASETAMTNQFLKQFEPAALDQPTTDKIKEIFGKAAKEVVEKRKQAGVTPEMLKKRTDAVKQAREEGKKQKEVREFGLNAMGATEEQKQLVLETEDMLAKARIAVGKLLTDEQKSKLSKQLQSNLKEPTAPKKPKS